MAKNYIEPGSRIMDRAYLYDGHIVHTGEALALAMLLHAKGSEQRTKQDIEQVGKMLNDPNQNKPKPRRKR